MTKPIVMIGSGGHASVLAEILQQQGRTLFAVISPGKGQSPLFNQVQHFDSDDDILQFPCNEVKLVNGVGTLPGQRLRHQLFDYFTRLNYEFESVVSKHAMLSSYATIGAGAQILTGSIIQTGSIIGCGTIINSGAIIEHDCHIGRECHIAPGSIICGGVRIGDRTHIATGASVIQGITIGKNCIIAAGSIVTKDMPDNTIIYGYRSKFKERS
ncbi:MAG: acetyltransferase [Shewanella sp.]